MAINLTTKYGKAISEKFKTSSFVAGNTSSEYDFTGAKTIRVQTPVTVPLVDYTRSGANRYGTPTEMQDVVQEMTMTEDKSFSMTIDKGNAADTDSLVRSAGKVLKVQIEQEVVPYVDKSYFKKLLVVAGKVATVSAPSKTTICGLIDDAIQTMDDALVPSDGRVLYLSGANFKLVRQSGEFLGLETTGNKVLTRGEIGEYAGAKVIKVPTSYFPTGVQFVLVHKAATLLPYKINDAKIHEDAPGISGALLEGRNYFDSFILASKSDGVYVATTATKQANPTIAAGAGTITITSASAASIKYTTDSSDPRYSLTALTASTGTAISGFTAGNYTVKAVAYHATNAVSDVTTTTVTVS